MAEIIPSVHGDPHRVVVYRRGERLADDAARALVTSRGGATLGGDVGLLLVVPGRGGAPVYALRGLHASQARELGAALTAAANATCDPRTRRADAPAAHPEGPSPTLGARARALIADAKDALRRFALARPRPPHTDQT